jgi:predicted metal-dependent enzyme (double-stranded beta helix superfamily)
MLSSPKVQSPPLPASIQNLIEAVEGEASMTPARARDLLREANLQPEDLAPWADFDHPLADSYGRQMVHDGGYFEMMVMSWAPGDYSAIHDHGQTQWGAVQLFGQAEHAVFQLQDGELQVRDRSVFEDRAVIAVAHDLIHQMGNIGQPPYLTFHLYGTYDRSSGVTADARVFDLEEGAVQFTDGGVFFTLPEAAIQRREEGLTADFATRLRHDVELLRRLQRMRGSADYRPVHARREERLWSALRQPERWRRIESHWHGEAPAEPTMAQREERAAALHLQDIMAG